MQNKLTDIIFSGMIKVHDRCYYHADYNPRFYVDLYSTEPPEILAERLGYFVL